MKTIKYLFLTILSFCFFPVQGQEIEGYRVSSGEGELKEVTVTLPGFNQSQTITVLEVNGKFIFQGCVVLDNLNDLQRESEQGRGGTRVTSSTAMWSDAVVPYVLDENHPEKEKILWAIDQINTATDFTIQVRNCERDYIEFTNLGGERDGGYYTDGVGRPIAGRRQVNIEGSGYARGSIVHELCHAIGMYHEHTRTDRDSFVHVHFDNISEEWVSQYKKFTFNPSYSSAGGANVGDYDFGSIMHYPLRVGIMTSRVEPGVTVGQRTALSTNDIASLNAIATHSKISANPNPNPCAENPTGANGSETSGSSERTLAELFKAIWGSIFNDSEPGQNRDRGGQSNQSFNIQYEVELVPQQTGMSCWAAGAAMLVGWYDRVCIDPEEIARRIEYWAQYNSDGLSASDMTMLDYWFLQAEPPQSYTVEGFVQLLGVYGPLWVATNEGNPHIRVVAGASGDGTPEGTILTIYDPWQRGMRRFRANNTGSVYQETFAEFERKNHELAETEMGVASPIYVAHN